MKILKNIQMSPSADTPRCQNCIHFSNDPALIEMTFKGLTTLSSAYASVRDSDGLCSYLDRYLSAKDYCDHFVTHIDKQSKKDRP